ncbi:MAG TPA: FtsQ-type POTRA domain-containing protein [Terriglobales bacterium]|jgi:cell division protein FtsQ
MARKPGPTIPQEELYPPPGEPVRANLDDARMLDLDVEQESPFLRGQKRVSVRRGSIPKKTATRLSWAAAALVAIVVLAIASSFLYRYAQHSWRFRVVSSDDIEITGLHNVSRSQVMDVMGGDIGRNIFFVSLSQRQSQLEQIAWVESASVMRFVPNHLKVDIQERTPVAFARIGSRIMLMDAAGTLMDLPTAGKRKYSFPVILGMSSSEPPSTRTARMKIYNDLVGQLDSGGAHYSQELSEVDLSDPEDVKVQANSPDGDVLVHLGSSDYLQRYKTYVAHIQEWRQQFSKVESVDLRYDRQIIVNPDLEGKATQQPLSTSAAKAAMAAGVKTAALINREGSSSKPLVAKDATTRPTVPPTKLKQTPKSTVTHSAASQKNKAAAKKTLAKTAPKTVASTTTPTTSSTTKSSKPSPAIVKEQDHP